MLPPGEQDLLLRQWNTTARPYPADATLVSLFAAQASATPEAVAAECAGQRMTYADLDAASGRLAAWLRAGGARPGTLVAVCLDRSLDLLVALLAVARTGAGYVPVDPGHPPARRDHILRDAAPAVVLTDADGSGYQPLSVEVRPTGTAYVLYTSGSTGRPKGVDVPHAQLANLLLALRDLLDAGPGDTWLAHTSASFDICAAELFLPLVTGGRTVIATDREARDPAALVRLIRGSGVTHVQATPSGWRMILDGGFGATGREPVVAVSGGEVLPPALAARLRARVRRLWNGYGPTEATVYTTMADVPEPVDVVSIGRPIANYTLYVLDDARRPVPLGVPGELWVGGAGVARGYLGRPDLTAERFVADPWIPGGRMYRTGDRVRYRPDGTVLFLGRTDNQVKIRGHRVELGEIEATLLEHPRVAQAAVRYCADDDPWLMAYVVPAGPPPDPGSLRAHVAASLPPAMVPAEWMMLDRFPVNANGKLDRAALPEPVRRTARPDEPTASRATDEVTETVRAIWCEVLKLDDVGDDEDLFDLGGHSLSITQIIAKVRERMDVELSFDVFFDEPTITGIAAEIARLREEAC
jgi:amino acid adenylation domain-containing protein